MPIAPVSVELQLSSAYHEILCAQNLRKPLSIIDLMSMNA